MIPNDFSAAEKAALKLAAERACKIVKKRPGDTERDLIGKLFTSMRQQECVQRLRIYFPKLRHLVRSQYGKRDIFLNKILGDAAAKVTESAEKDVDRLRSLIYSTNLMVREAESIIRRSDVVVQNLVSILER